MAMFTKTAMNPGNIQGRPFLSEVSPLNVQRRDDALYLLATEHGKPITPYDICKTLVLADVFHVIDTGKVIFGGKLYALPYGPITKNTLDDCKRWASGLFLAGMLGVNFPPEASPLQPSGLTGSRNHIVEFKASPEYGRRNEASWDWFSDAEVDNTRRAYEKVMEMGSLSSKSQRYFHDPVSAIGFAYDLATKPLAKPFKSRVEMNWFDVLDGAEQVEKKDVSYARAMLGLWT
jgi:hypothetical protein